MPALSAKVSRQKFGNPHYRVWGGNALVYFMFCYGALLIVFYALAALNLLPVY